MIGIQVPVSQKAIGLINYLVSKIVVVSGSVDSDGSYFFIVTAPDGIEIDDAKIACIAHSL